MPSVPNLKSPTRQASEVLTADRVVEVSVWAEPLTTAFGSYQLRKAVWPDPARPPAYALVPLSSAGHQLLSGDGDTFNPVHVGIVGVDDADATRQALALIWGRAKTATRELEDLCERWEAGDGPAAGE